MHRGIVRLLLLAIALAALLAVTGCGRADDRVVTVTAWTFVAPDGARADVTLPARVSDRLPRADATYHLVAHVDVPSAWHGRRLTLAFPQLHARASLTANGAVCPPLSEAMRRGYRGYTDQLAFRVPPEATRAGAIDLDLTVDYRHWMSGWIDVAPRLSDTDEGDAAFVAIARINRAQGIVCIAITLLTAFLYGLVYLRDRRRTTYAWFAVQGIFGGAGYAILQDGASEALFGPYENAFVPVFLCVGVLASAEFTHGVFGLGKPSRLWWWQVAVCVVAAACVPNPFVGPRVAPLVSTAMTVINVSYQVPTSARIYATRGRPLGALVILLSWIAIAILGLPDLVAWSGMGEIAGGLRSACIGLTVVAILQSMVLSAEHHDALAQTDALNTELTAQLDAVKAKNREVQRLNDELRRQIGARADALALALAQASAPRQVRSLEPDEIVAKRYRVVRPVGEGATGRVYEVARTTDGERLALKLLDPSADATEMARFAREAQIIAQLDHPNVVRIADVDMTSEGLFYLVVEFVEGLSLRHHYGRARSLKWNVEVLAQVAEGLAAVHARGIVHRDLKPGNVLVTKSPDEAERPRVKLADFGISSAGVHASDPPPAPAPSVSVERVLDRIARPRFADDMTQSRPSISATGPSVTKSDSLLTQTGAWMGTPKYMAPELGGAAKHARPAADVFGFGVMAYELLTGKAPFDEAPAIARAKGDEFVAPPPLRASAGELDATVTRLLEQCLAELPADRPDASALAVALRAYAVRLGGGSGYPAAAQA